jgi:hypothetical protein
MAGTLTISTLKDSSGVLSVANGMTGIPKAWATFQGGNGNTAGVINSSFNVSSVTVNGTGDYTVSFTTAMPNATYAIVGGALESTADGTLPTNRIVGPQKTAPLTTSVRIGCSYPVNSTLQTSYYVYFAIFSS